MSEQAAWFLATCEQCEPRLPQPFRDEQERDKWAQAHEQTIDIFSGARHTVTRSTSEA